MSKIMNPFRSEVINCFKTLHRTRRKVFEGDKNALDKARIKINSEFKKCKNVKDKTAISELLLFAQNVEKELKSIVVQAAEVQPNKYSLKITKDTVKLENIPYKIKT